jgi:hypothetical protein
MLDRSIYATSILFVGSFYNASARTNPPIIAREPVATWATAAFFVADGVLLLPVPVPVDNACVTGVVEAVVLEMVWERVAFEEGFGVAKEEVLFEAVVELAT